MTENYLIIIAVAFILYIIEAMHDRELEKLYNTKEEKVYVQRWHRWDFVFHVVVGTLIAYLYAGVSVEAIVLLFNLGVLRMLVLNSILNLLKGKKIWYLGQTSMIDLMLKKVEKLVFFLLLALNVVLFIYQYYG